MEGKYSEIS